MIKIYKCSTLASVILLVCSCSFQYGFDYIKSKDALETLEDRTDNISFNLRRSEIKEIMDGIEALEFEYNPKRVRIKGVKKAYQQLQSDIAVAKKSIPARIDEAFGGSVYTLINKSDYLIEDIEAVPLHASKGDNVIMNMTFEKPADVKLYNADSKKLIKTFAKTTSVNEEFTAPNSAIYVVEIDPKDAQYADISVAVAISSVQQFLDYKTVECELVECEKNDFRAVPMPIIETVEIFEEPRKHTLRSSLKAIFTGGDRALIAVEVPTGTTDVLYSLRISTSQSNRSSDGMFKPNTDYSYHKIKLLGLPIYDSSRGNGIISMILDDNVPYREEEAYCSMYIFYSDSEAKKFQDETTGVGGLNYDVNNTRVGTQSCNGRINARGKSVIYFGFLNERMRYQNYIWFEALALTSSTEYYNAKYTLVDPEINLQE